MSKALDAVAPPIGVLRRAAAGAWHVPAGIAFLLKRPRLWPIAALPAVIAGISVTGGLISGLYAAPFAETQLLDADLSPWIYTPLAATIWIAALTTCMAAGLGVALLLAAPILDRLSQQTETLARGGVLESAPGLAWEVAESLRGALYFLAAAPVVFVLGLVPVVGPAAAALWAAAALSFQETEPALARRGLTFAERRDWHRRFRPESLGFGLTVLLILVVPCANVVLAPALVVGATRLVIELEEVAAA
jgi:uncharacterized protein involved in cysteine biosynthesis